MSKIILTVLKEDFDGTDFVSPWRCPIAKAANRQFVSKNASEGINFLEVNGKIYQHRSYSSRENASMKELASKSKPDSVIFTIDLEPYEPVQD